MFIYHSHDIKSGSFQVLFLRQYIKWEHRIATSWSFLINYFLFMPIDLRKFVKALTFSFTKLKEVISSNIKFKFEVGVRSSIFISFYWLSLYFFWFYRVVSYGQVSPITVNSSLLSIATSGVARCNSVFCCGYVDVIFCWWALNNVAGWSKSSVSSYKGNSCYIFFNRWLQKV